MDNIKVSILVPAFNVECYIEDCLRSLMAQTLEEIEIVIVDDGSTDSTGDIAEQYAVSDNRVRVYHQEHQGVAEARNKCLSLAQGEYIGFVDSDDYVSADAFEQLYLRAKAYSADIVLGSIMYCYEDGTTDQIGDKTIVFQNGIDAMDGKQCFKALIDTGSYVPMVCGNLYRTGFIQQYQLLFDAALHEDEYFTPYALFFAKRVIDIKFDLYFYRQHPGSIMHSDNLKLRAEALWFIGDKLSDFAGKVISKYCEIGLALQKQANVLCNRAKEIYEKVLSTSPKKCLFIFSEESIAGRYGVGTYISQLIQCFDTDCWDIHVVTLYASKPDVQWKIENNIVYYEISRAIATEFIQTESNEKLYCKSIFYYLASRLVSKRAIYCHFNFANYYDLAMLFRQQLQAKIIFTLHYTDWSFDLLGDRVWLKHILANPIEKKDNRLVIQFQNEKKFMLDCCDYVIAIADHSYRMLEELYDIPKEKLVYIPNGIKDEYKVRGEKELSALRKKYGIRSDEKLVLFAGRLDLIKGFAELIKAIKLVKTEVPNVKLIMAGHGNFTLAFNTASPCWSDIIFTGFIPKEQLYELYAIADIGVIPSKHEEFGYVAVEMMMHELPIIVNNTTGLKEIVENGELGITFNYGENWNIDALKDLIISSLNKNKPDNQLIKKARENVLECYSLDSFRKRILSLYSCVENPYNFI